MDKIPPQIATFIAAELLFLIMRSRDITVVCKSETQREVREQQQVDRGLLRSLVLELFVFVPASAGLVVMIAPIMFASFLKESGYLFSVYTFLGIVSYGFPFGLVKRVVTRIALKTLREFAAIVPDEPEPQDNPEPQDA